MVFTSQEVPVCPIGHSHCSTDNACSPSLASEAMSNSTSVNLQIIEPRHDITNNVAVRPARTQISLGICPV